MSVVCINKFFPQTSVDTKTFFAFARLYNFLSDNRSVIISAENEAAYFILKFRESIWHHVCIDGTATQISLLRRDIL
jgi:hypothetical protein